MLTVNMIGREMILYLANCCVFAIFAEEWYRKCERRKLVVIGLLRSVTRVIKR